MKKRFCIIVTIVCLCCLTFAATASAAIYTAPLTMRLSTRTGPSTAYTEPGTFFNDWQGVNVKVLSKAQGNGVWWVQVEFMNNGQLYRAYTGAKRISLDISLVEEEQVIGTGHVRLAGEINGYYGPGAHYAALPTPVPQSAIGNVITAENGYVLFDFYDEGAGKQRRAWVQTDFLAIDWLHGQPVGSYLPVTSGVQTGVCYYGVQDSSIWCEIVSLGHNGQYSCVNLHFFNSLHYYQLPVYMESHNYGSFDANGLNGYLSFLDNSLFLEAYLPGYDNAVLMRLEP